MTEQNTNQGPKPGSPEYIAAVNADLDESIAATYQQEEFKVKTHQDNLKQFNDAATKSSATSGLKLVNKKIDTQEKHIAEVDLALGKVSVLAIAACKNTHILKEQVDKTVIEVDAVKDILINNAKDSNDQKYSDTYKMALPSAKYQKTHTAEGDPHHLMFATETIEGDDGNDAIVTESYECPTTYEPYYMYEENKEKDTDSEFFGELVYTGCILRSEQCNLVDNSDRLEFIRGAEDQVCYASLISA
jgi:delta 1-pyrroline-5-carboxylate dehydrogenase